jgi:UDP-N-acetylmuramoyl-L-alanyl-D-glutamate--2,6-diaminopimelate ligase
MQHVSAWSLRNLLAKAGIEPREPLPAEADVTVTSLSDDSRTVGPGACFIAVPGTAADGHRFINAAIAAGARSVVAEREVEVPAGVARVRVPDARRAVARLAAAFFRVNEVHAGRRLRLIGITGTNGKSTTAYFIRSILQADGHRTALLGTIRYDLVDRTVDASLTTPAPIALCGHLAHAISAGASYAVMETSSHALAQSRCEGLNFEVGVFTNLSGDHLDYHQTVDEYRAAKKRLFDRLGPDAFAAVNGEDDASDRMVADCPATVARYGIDGRTLNVRGVVRQSDWRGSTFDILSDQSVPARVSIPQLGRHNVMNSLAAAAAARGLGIRADAIREGLEAVTTVEGRLQRVSPDDCPFAVIVDYAHTDHALQNALRAIRPVTPGRVLCVFGCGGDRDRTKRPRMARAVAEGADLAFVTSDNPRSEDPMDIIREALPGFAGRKRCRVEVEPDRAAAIRRALEAARPGDSVLIAGKGHENYQIVGRQRLHFDDVKVARACLNGLEVTS